MALLMSSVDSLDSCLLPLLWKEEADNSIRSVYNKDSRTTIWRKRKENEKAAQGSKKIDTFFSPIPKEKRQEQEPEQEQEQHIEPVTEEKNDTKAIDSILKSLSTEIQPALDRYSRFNKEDAFHICKMQAVYRYYYYLSQNYTKRETNSFTVIKSTYIIWCLLAEEFRGATTSSKENKTNNTTMPEIEKGSRYNMPKVSKFEKGDDPDQWIQMYQDAVLVRSAGTNEVKLRMVPRYLNKSVRKWFYNQEFKLWSPTTLKQAKIAIKDYLYADSSDEENSESDYISSCTDDSNDTSSDHYTSDSSSSDSKRSRRKKDYKKKKTRGKIHTKNKNKEGKVTQRTPDPIDLLTKQINNLSLMVNEKQVHTTKTIENDRVQKLFDQVNHLALMISANEEEQKDMNKNQEKPKEALINQDKLDTLIAQITNLVTVLTDKQLKPNNQATANSCFNCKGIGHHAAECKAACKICKGTKTPHHPYYTCPDNKRNKEPTNSTSYLVSATNDKDNHKSHDEDDESDELPVENNLAAFKRNRDDKGHKEIPKIAENLDATGSFSIPGDRIKAADVANAKVFKCSLNQLNNSVAGFHMDLKRLATRKQKRKQKGIVDVFWTKADEPPDIMGYGAPRTYVIVQGSIQTNGVLDCGSVGCLMSAKMAKKLGFVNLEPSPMTHGMADGRKVDAVGYVQSVQITIKDISIAVDAVVFDQSDYDFLVGRRALHKFQLFTDWESYNWWIRERHSIEPLLVTYEGV
ncbi:hypothetical protein BDC45DRAFT_562331 [Circinella umbellata]|nr:hypothetical protein BDC45DRAFT_562331 [Circinella umbellata]